MRHPCGPASTPEDVLTPLTNHKRLVEIVRTLAEEVERLEEDNSQLRAAIEIYREVTRQSAQGGR